MSDYISLGEYVEKANTGADAIKRAPIVEYKTEYRCLRIGDISNDRKFEEWGYTSADEKIHEKFTLRKNDLVIARTGNTIGVATIIKEDVKAVYNNGLIRIKLNEKCNPYFIYLLVKSKMFKDFINQISGGTSTQPNVKIAHVLEFKIPKLSIRIQNKIADLLMKFDDKININNKIIMNLKTISHEIYKQWFVNFEFPNEQGLPYILNGGEMVESELGEIPKDWEAIQVKDISDANKYSLSKKDDWSYLNYLDTGNITDNAIDNIQLIDLNFEKQPSRAKRLVKPNDIVFSTVRPNQKHYGIIKKPVDNMVVSTGFTVLSAKETYSSELLYMFLTQNNMLDNLQAIAEQSTSAYPSIKADDILKQHIIKPTKEILEKFNTIGRANFDYIWELQQENKKLAKLRDSLLPKLLSGEIEIPDESVDELHE